MDEIAAFAASFTHDETITIKFEDHPETTLTVSKAVLCSSSDYFVAALQGQFMEAQTRTLRIPGCSLETFQLFLYCAIAQALPDFERSLRAELTETTRLERKREFCLALVNLWSLGSYLLAPKVQNRAMRKILYLLNRFEGIPSTAVELAFETSAADSLLCKMMVCEAVYKFVYFGCSSGAQERMGAIPGFFALFTVALKLHYTNRLEAEDYRHNEEYHDQFMVEEVPVDGH